MSDRGKPISALAELLKTIIESRSIPSVFKFALFFAPLALILSLSGFPVVDYIERWIPAILEEKPMLGGVAIGTIIGVTVVQLTRSTLLTILKTSVRIFNLNRYDLQNIHEFLVVLLLTMLVLSAGFLVGLL